MIIPPIGGVAGELSTLASSGLTKGGAATPGQTEGVAGGGLTEPGIEGASGGEAGSFSSELSGAITSLEQTQTSADGAAQALAAGKAQDPESAVATVADAQMAMELASQIRTKATEAAQSIFQTQV